TAYSAVDRRRDPAPVRRSTGGVFPVEERPSFRPAPPAAAPAPAIPHPSMATRGRRAGRGVQVAFSVPSLRGSPVSLPGGGGELRERVYAPLVQPSRPRQGAGAPGGVAAQPLVRVRGRLGYR